MKKVSITQIIIRKVFFPDERYITSLYNQVLSVFNAGLYDFPYNRPQKTCQGRIWFIDR